MKRYIFATMLLALFQACAGLDGPVAGFRAGFENEFELVTTGDFDGDGRDDIGMIDKFSGKYRLGYQTEAGAFTWIDFRVSGLQNLSSASAGKVLATNCDALVLASADTASIAGSQVLAVDASDRRAVIPARPIPITKLGPGTAVAVDLGGADNTPLDDLYIGCRYETPPKALLLRNEGKQFRTIGMRNLSGEPVKAIRGVLKTGQSQVLGVLIRGDDKTTFRVEDLSDGSMALIAETDVPAETECLLGHFQGRPLPELVCYQTNASNLMVYPLEGEWPGKAHFGPAINIQAGNSIKFASVFPQHRQAKLLLSFGAGERAELCDFGGASAPKSILILTNQATNDVFSGAVAVPDALVVFSSPRHAKPMFSTRYQAIQFENGKPAVKTYGTLPTLIESDAWTVTDIHKRILTNQTVKNASEMKPYTNAIPGFDVTYVMVPIPGGEFVMGSPDKEAGRQADEGPQHKVKIEPFWMGAFELTWNEYEIFMFTNTDRLLRNQYLTNRYVDKVADALSGPSSPYADMTFGMGKSGFPAIAMTQHAANKYCQWLSAKTGQFYRLPTEAEWEYAARAGTTTAYFFGEDPKDLVNYAWFGKNSDWKYQKIGKKKPNPWGLYDIYGNVVEWTTDQYDAEFYKQLDGKESVEPRNKPTKPYPMAVRGGCWDDDDPAKCRSAARRGSDRSWKMQDPQLPKSVWYFTDAQWVGFRLVRPLKVPAPEELKKYWISGVEKD